MENANKPILLTITGDAYERGVQHGSRFKEPITKFIASDFSNVQNGKNKNFIAPYHNFLQKNHPALFREIEGLAAGAGISLDQALLLQYRRELNRANSLDCSTVGMHLASKKFVAQTIDLSQKLEEYGFVMEIATAGEPRQLLYTFTGLIGYLGMNEHGLAIGINMVFSYPWKVGISPYLLIRELLKKKTVDECIDFIRDATISSSRSLTIMDTNKAVNVELTAKGISLKKNELLIHTNHYCHEESMPSENMNMISVATSKRRLNRFEELLQENIVHISSSTNYTEFIFNNILSDHQSYPLSICNHVEHERYPKTVAAVVMDVEKRAIHIRKGSPCKAQTVSYAL